MAIKETNPIIEIKDLYKSFKVGKGAVEVLKGVNLEVYAGEFVIIYGPSGCGKSTLLNTIVGLERPTQGEIIIRGTSVYNMKPDDRAVFRRQKFGIIYQQPNWIKALNVSENIAFPLCVTGKKERKSLSQVKNLMNLFRLDEFERSVPTELSGGQQQRVQVVRALVTNPWILVCDEPTGNLDTTAAADLLYVFQYLNEESKRTIVMVTHNPDYEKYATKIVKMQDGVINSVETRKKVSVSEEESLSEIMPEEKGATI